MERSVLETIQLLGLDLQLGFLLLLFALDGLATLARRIAAWSAAQSRRVRTRSVASQPSAATNAGAWSRESLSASGGHAA